MKEQTVKQRQMMMKNAASTSTPPALRADTTTGGEVIELLDGEVDFVGELERLSPLRFSVQGVAVEGTQSNSVPPLSQLLRFQQNQ